MKRVGVFCGSREGRRPEYRQAANALGRALAAAGLGAVYGGARAGLMGAVADGLLAGGAEVIGVLPHGLASTEFAHAGIARVELVDTMEQRKGRMIELADAFVALPGGFGTLDELFEVLTLQQVGLHTKPIGLLDTLGYWAPLRAQITAGLAEGFVPPHLEHALVVESAPEALVDALLRHQPPPAAVQWRQK